MTVRQRALKLVYPLLQLFNKLTGRKRLILENTTGAAPLVSFYSLSSVTNYGAEISFSQFKGKKVLLVNTASDCGYTSQYTELETLYEKHKDRLIVIGFPANDFKQEQGDDEEIAGFCKTYFDIRFLLMKKGSVVKKTGQHTIFRWLTDKNINGWNEQAPAWNFCKYLINENGILTHFFGTSISPAGKEINKAITAGY